MELEGLSTKLTLEEGITSSSSSDENCANTSKVIYQQAVIQRRFVRCSLLEDYFNPCTIKTYYSLIRGITGFNTQ